MRDEDVDRRLAELDAEHDRIVAAIEWERQTAWPRWVGWLLLGIGILGLLRAAWMALA